MLVYVVLCSIIDTVAQPKETQMKITKYEALQKMSEVGGHIFTAEFIKKDGSVRKMNCRLSVKKGVTGKGMAYNPMDKALLGVFDMQKEAFRMINVETLRALTIGGQEYNIV